MKNKFLLFPLAFALSLSGCKFQNNQTKTLKPIVLKSNGAVTHYYDDEGNWFTHNNNYEEWAQELNNGRFVLSGSADYRDSDFFLFTTESKTFTFAFQADDDLTFRLFKFGELMKVNPLIFHYGSGTTSIDLKPGSYYIEISGQYSGYNFGSKSYTLTSNMTTAKPYMDFQINNDNINKYAFAYWQNDYSPCKNENREDIFGDEYIVQLPEGMDLSKYLSRSIPKVYKTETGQKNFVDSEFYIWDKETLRVLATWLDSIKEQMSILAQGAYNDSLRAEATDDAILFFVGTFVTKIPYLGQIVDGAITIADCANLIATWVNGFNSTNLTDLSKLAYYMGEIKGRCISAARSENLDVVRVTRIGKFIYDTESGRFIYRRYLAFEMSSQDGGTIFDNDFINSKNHYSELYKDYETGVIKAFAKTSSEYLDYDGTVLDNFFYELPKTYVEKDENYHKVIYSNLYVEYEPHSMVYSESEGYHCEHCGHTKTVPTSSISKNDFAGFGGQYCDQVKPVNFTTADGYNVQAYGLRCGLIDDRNGNKYFALSGKSLNVTNAYIVLYFDEAIPVYSISFDFSLWSDNEGVKTKGKNFAECFVKENTEDHEFDDVMAFDIANLHTKDNPDNFTVTYGNRRIRAFKIHIVCHHSMTSTDAKGRFVLDNIELNKGIY